MRETIVDPYDYRAWEKLASKKYELATKDFFPLLDAGLGLARAHQGDGVYGAKLKRELKKWLFESAIEDYSKAILENDVSRSNQHVSRFNRGLCYQELGQNRNARKEFEYLARERGLAVDFDCLGTTQFNTQQFSSALASYRKAKELSATDNSLDEEELEALTEHLELAKKWANRRPSASSTYSTGMSSAEYERQQMHDFRREHNSRRGYFGPAHKVPDGR